MLDSVWGLGEQFHNFHRRLIGKGHWVWLCYYFSFLHRQCNRLFSRPLESLAAQSHHRHRFVHFCFPLRSTRYLFYRGPLYRLLHNHSLQFDSDHQLRKHYRKDVIWPGALKRCGRPIFRLISIFATRWDIACEITTLKVWIHPSYVQN